MNQKSDLFCRSEFPYYEKNGNRVYLDSASTALKPYAVIYSITDYLQYYTSNVHRSSAAPSLATQLFENSRKTIAKFINATSPDEIIFTSGATQSLNLIANIGFTSQKIVISDVEHHSNVIPWLMKGKGISDDLVIAETDIDGNIDLNEFEKLMSLNRNSFVSITHVSNVTGIEFPIKEIAAIAHRYNSLIMVDGCQAITHTEVDVQDLDVDFYVFSGHKLYGPTGIGILYAKSHLLEKMTPQYGGGGMVGSDVTWNHYSMANVPHRFEAGTPNIEGAIGLGAAIDWVNSHGIDSIKKHIHSLSEYAINRLESFPEFKRIGDKTSNILSITSDKVNMTDVGYIISGRDIAVRSGSLCAVPFLAKYDTSEAVRISFGAYSNKNDVDLFFNSLKYSLEQLK